jgi:hypothetical protein
VAARDRGMLYFMVPLLNATWVEVSRVNLSAA